MARYSVINKKGIVVNVIECGDRYLKRLLRKDKKHDYIKDLPQDRKQGNIGDKYDSELGVFIIPKPFDDYVLDKDTKQWKAPKPLPEDTDVFWDDSLKEFVGIRDKKVKKPKETKDPKPDKK